MGAMKNNQRTEWWPQSEPENSVIDRLIEERQRMPMALEVVSELAESPFTNPVEAGAMKAVLNDHASLTARLDKAVAALERWTCATCTGMNEWLKAGCPKCAGTGLNSIAAEALKEIGHEK